MEANGESGQSGSSLAGRIGFWLGLILFAALLAMPTPESMRDAVRETFPAQIKSDVALLAACVAQNDGGPVTNAPEQAEAQVVEARARVILAAAAVTALVACWWITVAIPIPVTSLLPMVLFPLLGVMPIKDAASPYANSSVFLFMGGFIIALGIERWGLHRRIALHVVRLIGTSRSNIVLGFMVATALVSMWISNTAATLMMLPIGLAIITAVGELDRGGDAKAQANFNAALMLGIAYAASVGGMGTPIGTPPNIVFKGLYARLCPDRPEIGFGHWMLAFVPLIAVFLPAIWLTLTRITCPVARGRLDIGREIIRKELHRLGRMRRPEAIMVVVFVGTALLWMTRSIPVGDLDYGWAACLERLLTPTGRSPRLFRAAFIDDATVALFMAALLFIISAGRDERGAPQRLMDWKTAQRLPWGILLLFGGGFSIAAGFEASGLSYWCGQAFAAIDVHGTAPAVAGTSLMITFLSEVTSNTAIAQVMLPIMARAGDAWGMNPLILMLPATLAASCGFMLPVATPPNAIVFGTGHVRMRDMVFAGLISDLIGVVLITAVFFLIGIPVLGI